MFDHLTQDEIAWLFDKMGSAIDGAFEFGWTFEACEMAAEFREIRCDLLLLAEF